MCREAQPLLSALNAQHDETVMPGTAHFLAARAGWDMRQYRDILRLCLQNEASEQNQHGRLSIIGKLLTAHARRTSGDHTYTQQLLTSIDILAAASHLPAQECATLAPVVVSLLADPSQRAHAQKAVLTALSALLQAEYEAEDYESLATRVACIKSAASSLQSSNQKAVVAAHEGSWKDDMIAASAAADAQRARDGSCLSMRSAQQVQRNANGEGEAAARAAAEYDEIQAAAADAGGYLEGAAPGRCRALSRTLIEVQGLPPLPALQMQTGPFDVLDMREQLCFPCPALDGATQIEGIRRCRLRFAQLDGNKAEPADLGQRALLFANEMLECRRAGRPISGSGDSAAQVTKGGAGVVWMDAYSTQRMGDATRMGATVSTLNFIKLFDTKYKLPEVKLLMLRALADGATHVRYGAQPANPDENPVLHMDQAVDEVAGGLEGGGVGQVLCRFAVNMVRSGRPFLLSNDAHGEYVTELPRDEPGDAVCMLPEVYTQASAKRKGAAMYHAASAGSATGLTLIITIRDRGAGYSDLMARLHALGLTVT